jgi:hypothetical protein
MPTKHRPSVAPIRPIFITDPHLLRFVTAPSLSCGVVGVEERYLKQNGHAFRKVFLQR